MTITYSDLNLTPSPYTSVVRIAIRTDERAAGESLFGPGFYSNKDVAVMIRDKDTSDIYTVPVRLNAIRARLGLGRYQVLGQEASKVIRGDSVIALVAGQGTKTESTEIRIEFSVLPSDLGKEVNLGSYDPVARTVSGDRLALSN